MTGADVVALLDANVAESLRTFARFHPPTLLLEQDDVLYTTSGTRFAAGPFNSVIGVGAVCPDPARLFDVARAFYDKASRGFSIYTRAHHDGPLLDACERAGLVRVGNSPGMVLRERVPAKALPDSVVIREVSTEERAGDFVEVVAGAYLSIGVPPQVSRRVFSAPTRWLLPHLAYWVLYAQDQPVSAAMALFSHGMAGVYWVGTLPAFRRRGYAEALMRHVNNTAFDRGASFVALQATPLGEPVYVRVGFREVTRYPWFLSPREMT